MVWNCTKINWLNDIAVLSREFVLLWRHTSRSYCEFQEFNEVWFSVFTEKYLTENSFNFWYFFFHIFYKNELIEFRGGTSWKICSSSRAEPECFLKNSGSSRAKLHGKIFWLEPKRAINNFIIFVDFDLRF